MTHEQSTEQRILAAAKEIFLQKGFDGARMQEISELAGINKALLHYYYRSKDQLFQRVFEEESRRMMTPMFQLLHSDLPILEKVKGMVGAHFNAYLEDPRLPMFFFSESLQHPELLASNPSNEEIRRLMHTLVVQLEHEMDKGTIRRFDPEHLIINALALGMFPFVAKPMMNCTFGFDEDRYREFMAVRREMVADFMDAALRID